MAKLKLITSQKSNRYQYIKWLLAYLGCDFEVTNDASVSSAATNGTSLANPSLLTEDNTVISGEDAIVAYLALTASESLSEDPYKSSSLSLLGYSTKDVFQVESLLELMSEIQRFAYDCILYSQLDISYLPEDLTEFEKVAAQGGTKNSKNFKNFVNTHSLKATEAQKGHFYFNRYYQIRCHAKIDSLRCFIGPKNFLVGYLTVADFKLAGIVDLFGKICSKYRVLNPFGNFNQLEYAHLYKQGMPVEKSTQDDPEVEFKLDSEKYTKEDPFENLRICRENLKLIPPIQKYIKGNKKIEESWIDEAELLLMADLGRHVSKECVDFTAIGEVDQH